MTQALDRIDSEDGRYYVLNPGKDNEERFRSVTAPLSRWDKDGLLPWAAGLAGRAALDELPSLVASLTTSDCGRSYHPNCDSHDWQTQCPQCRCRKCEPCLLRWMRDRHVAESHRRSDEGSRVHALVDHWASTGVWLTPDEDIVPYVKTFKQWVESIGLMPEHFDLLEARVINREHMYAGTLDCVFWIFRDRSPLAGDILDRISGDGPRLDRAQILGDYKSREAPGRRLFMDQPLQLAGYRYAETIVLKDGTELPMFTVDAAAIIQIRPDATSLELVLADPPEFDVFLCLLAADEWAVDRGKQAIGARTFKFSDPIKRLRAADARKRVKANKLAMEAAERAKAEGVEAQAAMMELIKTESPKAAPEGDGAPEDPPPPPQGPPAPGSGTPAERGARAAAAARSGVSPVLQDLAETHGGTAGKVRYGQPVGRQLVTVQADLEIPF